MISFLIDCVKSKTIFFESFFMEIRFFILVTPNASKERLILTSENQIKCYVQAPAVDGKANAAVIAFFAKKLGLGKRCVCIVDGEKSRHKSIVIDSDLSQKEILQLLGLESQDQLF